MKCFIYFKICSLSLFLLFSLNIFGQTNYQKIEVFTKIWGFLKYHHPAVAAGSINWDSVYVSSVPKIKSTASDAEFNEQVLAIINSLGPLQKNQKAVLANMLFAKNHDLEWINDSKIIHLKLKNKLNEIYIYRNQGKNKYIKLTYSTADYSGENQYENMGFPNQYYRLLFLARFWNAINYFAPYKYEIGEDWGNVLARFVPKMISAKDTLSYYKTLLQLSVSLHDGHSQFTIADDNSTINNMVFGEYSAPIYAAIVDGMIIVRKVTNDSLHHVNIRPGDIILSIDNEPAVKRMARIAAYISASNNISRNKYLTWVLFNTHNDYQSLRIKREDRIFTVRINCTLAAKRDWHDLTDYTYNKAGYKTIGNSIAYVYAWQMWHGNMDTIKTLIKSKKAVIFDVRNYPNGDDFYNIFDIFLREPKVINQSLCISINNPGYFLWKPSPTIGNINQSPYSGKVIILADERAQSQGEYSVMCFQTIPNSVTVGSQTAGADGVKTLIPMGGKLALSYSGYGMFYPDKSPTQRRGVRIDIEATKTVEDISRDKDVALAKALEYLKEKGID